MKGLSPYEIRQLILSVGTRKSVRPLSPVEVGILIQKALDAGEKREEIADRLHLDGSTVIGTFRPSALFACSSTTSHWLGL